MSSNPKPVNTLSNSTGKPSRSARKRKNRSAKRRAANTTGSSNSVSVVRSNAPRQNGNNQRNRRTQRNPPYLGPPEMIPAHRLLSANMGAMSKQHFPQIVLNHIKDMMIPSDGWSRFPGNAHNVTALCRSIREFTVYANFTLGGPGNTGRGSFVLSPVWGSNSTNPIDWQLSVVDVTNGFPNDLSIASSFVTGTAGPLSADFRFDRLIGMTQPTVGVNTGNYWQAFAPGPTHLLETPIVPGGTILSNGGLYPTITNGPGTSSNISLPVGQYQIFVENRAQVATVPGLSIPMIGVNGAIVEALPGSAFLTNPVPNTGVYIDNYLVTIYNNTQYIQLDNPYGGLAFPANTGVVISPGFFPNRVPLVPLNGGMVSKSRPTACSALVTNKIADNYSGGTFAMNLVDNDTLKQEYFVNGSQNSLACYENLSEINGRPAYRGEAKDGCYGFWVPLDITQTKFVTPDEQKFVGYPQLVCSYQYSNAAGLTGVQPVAAVQVIVIHEYETSSPIPETCFTEGTLEMTDRVLQAFDKIPVTTSNPKHKGVIGGFLSKLPKVASDMNGIITTGKNLLSSFGF